MMTVMMTVGYESHLPTELNWPLGNGYHPLTLYDYEEKRTKFTIAVASMY